MPITPSHPGVPIEVIPTGIHAVTGVSTSITAFIGWAAQGPTTRAQLVTSWSDYCAWFGGLDARSLLGYALFHFFLNGGQQAYIVRLGSADAEAASVTIGSSPSTLTLTARNPGDWANHYGIGIARSSSDANRFRLQVISTQPGAMGFPVVESFEDLSMVSPDPQGRHAADVINRESNLIIAAVGDGATNPPPDTPAPAAAAPWSLPMLGATVAGQAGTVLTPNSVEFEAALWPTNEPTTGVYLLDDVDLFNVLCVPGETTGAILSSLASYCEARGAFLIADSDPSIGSYSTATNAYASAVEKVIPKLNHNAALYFPWIFAPDALNQNVPTPFPPCGFVAGIYARIDASRGVWTAPAGTDAELSGATGVTVPLDDEQNDALSSVGVNSIRVFKGYGTVIWGARTARTNSEIESEWKYVPIRRMALYVEASLRRGLQWIVLEVNNATLWARIRQSVGAFMHSLFQQGAFQGATSGQAYFVKCDSETTTPADQKSGVVNVVVGFAPLEPAEFVVIEINQLARQTAS